MELIVCNNILFHCAFTFNKMTQLTLDNDVYFKIPANFQVHYSMRLCVF